MTYNEIVHFLTQMHGDEPKRGEKKMPPATAPNRPRGVGKKITPDPEEGLEKVTTYLPLDVYSDLKAEAALDMVGESAIARRIIVNHYRRLRRS